MGGTDDPDNLIKLTIEEHAEAHRKLYDEYGKWEDFLAWKVLLGQINPPEASKIAHKIGSIKGGYAKKPNKVPAHNKVEYYCIGCRKRAKPSVINSGKGHELCYKNFYGLEISNQSWFKQGDLRNVTQAKKNNSIVDCPHCGKSGQYRAMKRWHFDNCKSK
jgi:hypothetical protein